MRTFVVFFFYFVNISVYGQSFETNFVVKNAYYVSIDIDTKQDYPIMFDILLDKNDSLLVDASNKQNFINGILQNSLYIPRCWSLDAFVKIYGNAGVDTYSRFRNMFFNEMDKKGRKETIKLESGEMVSISYFAIKGVFVLLNKEVFFSYGLDQSDNPEVNKPCIPLAVTEYEETCSLSQNRIKTE